MKHPTTQSPPHDRAWLKAIIAEKKWIRFDLDDTLHNYRHTTGIATNEMLETIHLRHEVSISTLKGTYSRILGEQSKIAFTDGKTSHDYRLERIITLLGNHDLPHDKDFVSELLESYEATLMESLNLKEGAMELLSTLKDTGKKIVITEGPVDAQKRTIERLGIEGCIDFLFTTNQFGVSKADGLFPKVLKCLDISPSETVYIGDSEERDKMPAMKEG
ncbi:MAG: hypothetical protein CL912_32000 [Deltaproteobacteria bacterium]|nr:hypothetical protein [Deltaproteobacteria bacterium]